QSEHKCDHGAQTPPQITKLCCCFRLQTLKPDIHRGDCCCFRLQRRKPDIPSDEVLIHPREPVVNHTAKRVEPLAHLATKCAKALVHRATVTPEPLGYLVSKCPKPLVHRFVKSVKVLVHPTAALVARLVQHVEPLAHLATKCAKALVHHTAEP